MNPNDLQQTIDIIKTNLQPLADKIGQGAGWTYELFLRQVYVNAFTELLWIPIGGLLLILSKKLIQRKEQEGYDDFHATKWFIIVPALGLGLFFIFSPIAELIQALVNPNYQAIKLIIDLVKTQTAQ